MLLENPSRDSGDQTQISSRDLSKVLLPASILKNDWCAAKKLNGNVVSFEPGQVTLCCVSVHMHELIGRARLPCGTLGGRGRGWDSLGSGSMEPRDLASEPLG